MIDTTTNNKKSIDERLTEIRAKFQKIHSDLEKIRSDETHLKDRYLEGNQKLHWRIFSISSVLLFSIYIDVKIGTSSNIDGSGAIFGITISGLETEEVLMGILLYILYLLFSLSWNHAKICTSERTGFYYCLSQTVHSGTEIVTLEREISLLEEDSKNSPPKTARIDREIEKLKGKIIHQRLLWPRFFINFIEFNFKTKVTIFLPLILFYCTNDRIFDFYNISLSWQLSTTIVIYLISLLNYCFIQKISKKEASSQQLGGNNIIVSSFEKLLPLFLLLAPIVLLCEWMNVI